MLGNTEVAYGHPRNLMEKERRMKDA